MSARYATEGRQAPGARERGRMGVLYLAVLVMVIVAIAAAAVGALGRGPAPAGEPERAAVLPVAEGRVISTPQSTPVANWEKGIVPYLYQTDGQWCDLPYAGGTIGENACGPTCLAMVYVALTGDASMTPAEMAEMSERDGHAVNGMTAWTLMTEGAERLGLASEELPAVESKVESAFEAGKYVIASVSPGDFTDNGHFIVLAGLDGDGFVNVRDPNSESRSLVSWDLSRVLSQCSNLWAIG